MDAKAVVVGSLKSKTQWVAMLLIALGVLQDQSQVLTQFLGPDVMGKVLAGGGVLMALLRAITTSSLTDKAGLEVMSPSDNQSGLATVRMLLVLACLSLGFALGGCGSIPRAPQGILEQIEAAELSLQQLSESITNLTCTQYVARKCVEPGKTFDADTGIAHRDKVQQARAALRSTLTLGGGQIGECLGEKRTQQACLAAVKLVLIEMERKVLQAQGGKP